MQTATWEKILPGYELNLRRGITIELIPNHSEYRLRVFRSHIPIAQATYHPISRAAEIKSGAWVISRLIPCLVRADWPRMATKIPEIMGALKEEVELHSLFID